MQNTLRIGTTVQPSDKVEIVSPELEAGQTVDVVVLNKSNKKARPIMEILNSGPERRLSQTAEEVKAYLAQEKGVVEPLTLKYTRHAAHAMEERRIAKDWKEAVVREPSLRTSDAKRSRGRAVSSAAYRNMATGFCELPSIPALLPGAW